MHRLAGPSSDMSLSQLGRELWAKVANLDIAPKILDILLAAGYTSEDLDLSLDNLHQLSSIRPFNGIDGPVYHHDAPILDNNSVSDTQYFLEMVDNDTASSAFYDTRCHALKQLLAADDLEPRVGHLITLLRSLNGSWWSGSVVYSQDTMKSYSIMSFAEAYYDIELKASQGRLKIPSDAIQLMQQHIPVVLVQMASLILVRQNDTDKGDHDEIFKVKAYETLALLAYQGIPFFDLLKKEIQEAIDDRRQALKIDSGYYDSLSSETQAYVLAALKSAAAKRPILDEHMESKNLQIAKELSKFSAYFAGVDYMKGESLVSIKVSILEASFYTALLKTMRTDIFPQTLAKEKNKYLEYIPPMFTFESTYFERCVPPQWLFDIMLWSMFIFLVDEFIEANVISFSPSEIKMFKAELERIHPDPDPSMSVIRVPQLPYVESTQILDLEPPTLTPRVQEAVSVLYAWASWVTNWDRLANASAVDMQEFRSEIKKYLQYHVHQIEDSAALAFQQGRTLMKRQPSSRIVRFKKARTAYTTWTHTVGGGHISAPVSLAMAACYMGSWARQGKDGWSSIMQRILAHETNIHVAAYCRMYNDYGSLSRDADECNLNSVNFPEFWTNITEDGTDEEYQKAYQKVKAQLLEVAKHERFMADVVAEKFYDSLAAEETSEAALIASCMKVYFRSGELFSDMYLTRDVTNSVK